METQLPETESPSTHASDAHRLTLLIVDDDVPVLRVCSEIASRLGYEVYAVSTSQEARQAIKQYALDMVLMDLRMPGGGLSLLEEVRLKRPRTAVVIMTAFASVTSAVEAMRMGAADYLTKPFGMDELTSVLERASQKRISETENRRPAGSLRAQAGFGAMISQSPEMQKLYRIVEKVATATHPVLILGEAGSGKETIARSIHASGPNASRRFTLLECHQLAPAVLEGELFGYGKDHPVTGSEQSREPLLCSPEGGTLYLDGIDQMPLPLQARLLRAIQNRALVPPGSAQGMPITVRLLAGSSRDIAAQVDAGSFRKDLYYRLSVVSLRLPPLRSRPADIPVLAEYFVDRIRRESAVPYRLSMTALNALKSYDWPGNVRELENAIERACSLSSGPVLHISDLPTQVQSLTLETEGSAIDRVDDRFTDMPPGVSPPAKAPIVSIAELEREAILNTIRQLHGDKLMAAKLLGIGKTTLYRKLKEYGIVDV